MKSAATAWMIRNDGKAIPCICHIYGSNTEIEETLFAAEWLYKNSLSEQSKMYALLLISAYGRSLNPHRNSVRNLFIKIKSTPYTFLHYDFIIEIAERMPIADTQLLGEYNDYVNHFLNNEFLRARYGGMYNTEADVKDIYYRISSNDFDWSEIIMDHLKSLEYPIDTVTVLRDFESTGESNFYLDDDGKAYNKYPVTDILKKSVKLHI